MVLAPVPPTDISPTIPSLLARAVREFGDHVFVVTADEERTFAELEQASAEMAWQLIHAGAGKASRVAMLMPHGPDWIVAFLAITRIGAVALPISTFATPAEAHRMLVLGDASHLVMNPTLLERDLHAFVEELTPELAGASSPRLMLRALPFLRTVIVNGPAARAWATPIDSVAPGPVDRPFLEALESEVVPADLFFILFTSGSTSGPKAVVHTHGANLRHVMTIARLREMRRGDRFFAVSPFFWIAGLNFQLLPALLCGGTVVCQERFDPPSALDLIERTKPRLYFGWPNATARLRNDPSFAGRDLSGVPWLPPPDAPAVDPGLRHAGMGMTETCGNHTMATAAMSAEILPEKHRGSFGPKVPYVQHKIIDPDTGDELPPGVEGEICIRGYSVMVGYAKREREEVFDIDGWFHTGDRGSFRDGLLFFTGRANDMIKTAGSNVAPKEVEDTLATLPEVKLSLVIGVPDDQRGERVTIAVVPKPGHTIDRGALRTFLRSKLSAYKVPRDDRDIVVLRDEDIPWINDSKADRKVVKRILIERTSV